MFDSPDDLFEEWKRRFLGDEELAARMREELGARPMRNAIVVVIPGKPFAWQRARTGNGRHFTSPEMRAAKETVAFYARSKCRAPITSPVRVELDFFFALKKGRGHKATKPDIDNLEKLVLDACNGIAYVDDGQVVDIRARKWSTGPARTVLKLGAV